MPDTITQIADAMQTVLDHVPEQNARSTGFVRRQRKLTASVFVKALVFGFLANPHASRDELTRVAATLGLAITPQALDERLTSEAAELLRRVLQASIQAMITADPVALAILDRFTEVVLLDSSTISLPEEFRSSWAGCGSVNPAKGNAAFKLSLAYFYCIPHIRRWIFNRGNTLRERCAYRRACSLRRSQRVLRRQRKDG